MSASPLLAAIVPFVTVASAEVVPVLIAIVAATALWPIPADSPIRELPNVFLSPHIAGVTAACRPRFFSFMVDELERLFGGHETLFDITPRVLANRRGLVEVSS